MEKYNKLLRNITELIEKGLYTSKDLKKGVEDSLKLKMEIIANKLNFVSREEFEVQKKIIEKLQKVRNIIGRHIIITSGVRCEFYNTSINASMNSSHIPDSYGIGNAVDIACTNSKDRYELVELSQKFFKRIGISGGSYGGFIHLDVDRSKVQEVMWLY